VEGGGQLCRGRGEERQLLYYNNNTTHLYKDQPSGMVYCWWGWGKDKYVGGGEKNYNYNNNTTHLYKNQPSSVVYGCDGTGEGAYYPQKMYVVIHLRLDKLKIIWQGGGRKFCREEGAMCAH